MKSKTTLFVLIIYFCIAFGFSAYASQATAKKPQIYNPALNVKKAIQQSLVKAKQEKKHLLLMFGGNWCPWCHKLHTLFNSDKRISQLLDRNYIVIMVDVGEKPEEPLNRDLVSLYRVKGFGYPSLAILDAKGKLLVAQSTGVLEKGKNHDPQKILAFLTNQLYSINK